MYMFLKEESLRVEMDDFERKKKNCGSKGKEKFKYIKEYSFVSEHSEHFFTCSLSNFLLIIHNF